MFVSTSTTTERLADCSPVYAKQVKHFANDAGTDVPIHMALYRSSALANTDTKLDVAVILKT